MLMHGLTGSGYQGGRASHIALGEFQAGQKHLTGNDSVSVVDQPRQLDTLLSVLLSSKEVVPFVAYPGQAKMRFAGKWQRRIACQVQDAPVGLGRQ